MPYDLFGEVPVTWPEVYDWLREVAGFDDPTSPRATRYATQYDVVSKVRAAKVRAVTSLSRRPQRRLDR